MKAVALPALPIDMQDYFLMTMHLTPKQLGVWLRLRCHIWQHGRLPQGASHLAAIGGVHPRAWEHMAAVLEPLFDQDEAGNWHDQELEDERAAVLVRRASLQQRGAAGAARKWRSEASAGAPQAMATAMAIAIDDANGQEIASGVFEMATALAEDGAVLAPHGPTDGLKSFFKQGKIEDTDGPADGRAATGADDASHGHGDGHDANVDVVNGNDLTASAMAMATGPALALTMADPMAEASPSALAGTMAPAIAEGIAMPSDGDIIGALRKVAKDKIIASILTPAGIQPIKQLLAEGCVFTRDVLPAFQASVPNMKDPLRSFRAPFLQQAVRANRDVNERAEKTAAAQAGQFFAVVGTTEWTAWNDHRRRSGIGLLPQMERDGVKGWLVETQWPPTSAGKVAAA